MTVARRNTRKVRSQKRIRLQSVPELAAGRSYRHVARGAAGQSQLPGAAALQQTPHLVRHVAVLAAKCVPVEEHARSRR